MLRQGKLGASIFKAGANMVKDKGEAARGQRLFEEMLSTALDSWSSQADLVLGDWIPGSRSEHTLHARGTSLGSMQGALMPRRFYSTK